MEYAIEINNVSKVYNLYNKPSDRLKEAFSITRKSYHRDFYALHPLDVKVKKGECFGIIGVNGSGKSTLLKMITGVLNPTTGDIKTHGRVSALLELGAGFNMEFTGIENIYLNGMVMGYSREEMDKKIPDICAFADIGDFVKQPVKTYSSGMFARLAFAVAINVDPDILIVDEALSVGDIYFQSKCFKKFDEFKAAGKTIIFVTHDMGCVFKYCDTVMVLNAGEKVAEGEPAAMIDIYKKILANQYDPTTKTVDAHKDSDNDMKPVAGKDYKPIWKEHLAMNPKPSIYGDKKAEIVDFAVIDDKGQITNTVVKEKPFQIKVALKFNETLKDVISSMTIKTSKGENLMGTNTFLEGVTFNDAKAGDIVIVTFKQVMHLQPGEYLLSLGCTRYENDDLHIFNRLYDIVSLDVIGTKTTVGYFDPNSQVTAEILK